MVSSCLTINSINYNILQKVLKRSLDGQIFENNNTWCNEVCISLLLSTNLLIMVIPLTAAEKHGSMSLLY